jgi:hypothetical protein
VSRHAREREHDAQDPELGRAAILKESTGPTTHRPLPTAPPSRRVPRPPSEGLPQFNLRIEHIEHRDYLVRASSPPAAIQQLLATGLERAWQHASHVQPDQFKIVHDTD